MCDVNGFWCILVNWPTAPGCNKSEIPGEKLRLEKIRHERLPKLIHNSENCKVAIFNRRYIFIHGCFSIELLCSFFGGCNSLECLGNTFPRKNPVTLWMRLTESFRFQQDICGHQGMEVERLFFFVF